MIVNLLKKALKELTLIDTETDSSKNFTSVSRRAKLGLEIKTELEKHEPESFICATHDIAGSPKNLSTRNPSNNCQCRDCLKGVNDEAGLPILLTRMTLCPSCGNKRCPHADNHRNECSGSNEPGQIGSMTKIADQKAT